jgi:predicted nuclease of predicted toxin-antitoxin system
MRIVIDVNLSPQWVSALERHDVDAVHWTSVGPIDATDREIMRWAATHDRVVFTHDLDFSAILASTQATGPSVLQIRTEDVLPSAMEAIVVRALDRFKTELREGAIVSVDPDRARVRVLPLP